MSPEVLIYIQKVKTYLENDENARGYFLDGVDEELFYQHLIEISQKNFEKDGEPTLTQDQFELLRKTMKAIYVSKNKTNDEDSIDEKIYMKINGFGVICLN